MRPTLTPVQLNARLRFIIGIIVVSVYAIGMLAIIYSLMFVDQPAKQTPNDAEFFKILSPGLGFVTGVLSMMMVGGQSKNDKDGDGIPDSE
jgi:hypothetical protein